MTDAATAGKLGPVMSIAMVIGLIVGAGIFLLPASIAPFGVSMFSAWAVTIAGFLALAFAFSILAVRVDGGPYEYVREAFGPETAFLTNWSYLVSCWSASAALAAAMAGALARAVPAVADPALVAPISVGAVVLVTAIASTGARSAGRTQVVTVALKLVPLVLVVGILAAVVLRGGALQPLADRPLSLDATAAAAAIMSFSLIGFEAAAYAAGKTADQRRTVPLATMAGTALTGLLFFASCTAVALLVPLDELAKSTQPFADAVGGSLGEGAGKAIALFVAVSAFGALNANVLITGEIGYDMALDRSAPTPMARNNRFGMPAIALVASAVPTVALILANSSRGLAGLFTFMVLLTTVSTLLLYAAVVAAAIRQRISPLARVVVALAFIYALWAIYASGVEAIAWGFALLAAGWPIRWLSRRFSSAPPTAPAAAPAAPRG